MKCKFGIVAVIIGQIFTLIFFQFRRITYLGKPLAVQKVGAKDFELSEALKRICFKSKDFFCWADI